MRKTIIAAGLGMMAACSMPVLPPAPAIVPAGAAVAAAPAPAALARDGRYDEAIALLEERVRRTPGAAQLGDLGYAYYLGGYPKQAQAALERACLLAPSNPVPWERLAALLEATGDSGRALEAMRQARMLREREEGGPRNDKPGEAAGSLWPDGMARVEVRQVGAGLVEVARVEPAARVPRASSVAATSARLEVSNGNGIRGMAAAVAQRLRAEGMQVVRLTNTIPFNVQETRVEVRGSGEPQLRIVLGKDAGIKKPPGVSGRQAP
ncbi:LytR cell envelope-related transcriptional attenuator [Duganella sp. CF458]|uniref:LytR C-terminal domain-containing protein n=1 Tax=Duganella sp. CF458 TaxID=1884368 RepID=UPI0008F1A882|nr:LytR C-terminal domain-containing protein [Duganella sp. CF458]SFF69574.1 LytR cell envelope-related transcriptional attenuator [Duganella sp. CF458]